MSDENTRADAPPCEMDNAALVVEISTAAMRSVQAIGHSIDEVRRHSSRVLDCRVEVLRRLARVSVAPPDNRVRELATAAKAAQVALNTAIHSGQIRTDFTREVMVDAAHLVANALAALATPTTASRCDCGKIEHGRHHMDCPARFTPPAGDPLPGGVAGAAAPASAN